MRYDFTPPRAELHRFSSDTPSTLARSVQHIPCHCPIRVSLSLALVLNRGDGGLWTCTLSNEVVETPLEFFDGVVYLLQAFLRDPKHPICLSSCEAQ
jgi:hypothetical protein